MLSVMIDVSLKTTSGVPLTIRAGVVPHLTATAERSPIKTNQNKKLKKELDLLDALPATLQTSNKELLVGNDYYHNKKEESWKKDFISLSQNLVRFCLE